MKKIIPVLAVLAVVSLGAHHFDTNRAPSIPSARAQGAAVSLGTHHSDTSHGSSAASAPARDAIASAFADHRSGIEVTGRGTVTRILPDDLKGSPHQRFILTLPSGQTLLIAHNIALAPRIPSLKKGDLVRFKGEYEWNARGGVIHWTHEDPHGRHDAGWLEHNGRTYH